MTESNGCFECETKCGGDVALRRRLTMANLATQKKKQLLAKNVMKSLGEGGTVKDAALATGYNAEYGSELVRHDEAVRNYLFAEMEKVGITSPLVATKMYEGLHAMTPPKKEGGERYEDYFVRKQYLDMYFRLRGMYAPEKHEIQEKKVVIIMTADTVKGLLDSRAITEEEILDLEEINHTPITEDMKHITLSDAELDEINEAINE